MPNSGGKTGLDVLSDPGLNKSTAFSVAERDRLKLRGLLPAAVCTQRVQIARGCITIFGNLRRAGARSVQRGIWGEKESD